ncbi:MAG: tannase [Lachnospiraceae bacterium]|nr:tannase [Ruminococcus sp.]MCM1276299.1 tannase [Lachnospiraceae bacterium]
MIMKKKLMCALLVSALLLTGCNVGESSFEAQSEASSDNSDSSVSLAGGESEVSDGSAVGEPEVSEIKTNLDKIDMTKWQYNAENDVYWQCGIVYCETPADEKYENLGIYVPGAYMSATENGDGTYACEVNAAGTVNGFTAETAPIVIPVETPGYSAMSAPTGYSSNTADYTNAGFVYLYAGCRGRDAGAPAGVADLKAAIRYFRYTSDILPGDTEKIFSFGMSGGGAQSALLGATGDSELYTSYLEQIGAVSGVSDAVTGSMCWCPITNLDLASEAYEWNLGVTRSGLDEDMQKLSDAMAERFALYINELGLTDENGNALTLTASDEGIYQAGSYYDYLKSVVENSLNNFLADTEFPYTASSGGMGGHGGFGGGMGNFGGGNGGFGNRGELPDLNGEKPNFGNRGEMPNIGDNIYEQDGINRDENASGVTLSGTYETARDYIDALNSEKTWVTYDSVSNTATITSVADFVCAFKTASKSLGAFDALDGSQGENTLFGYGNGSGAHFDAVMAELLKDNSEYGAAYAADLAKTDALGNTVDYRVDMYNPLYYLCEYYDGCNTSNVADFWRIRTGINQSDTALTTEVNLALALESCGADVDFETVWDQGHTQAERTGSSSENFIAWVVECCK